jgi:starvation-inducible outer membrane lipoprotein
MIRFVAFILSAALLAGCSSIPTMKRDEMSSFDQDNYQCSQESESARHRPLLNAGSVIDNRNATVRLYTLCMKARGYREE